MGLGMRIIIVKDDGSLERLPFGRYNRLLRHDSNERLLQYAGKRVRCAVIVVESFERIPVEIVKSQYSFLLINHPRPKGRGILLEVFIDFNAASGGEFNPK